MSFAALFFPSSEHIMLECNQSCECNCSSGSLSNTTATAIRLTTVFFAVVLFHSICRFHPSAACQSISLLILIWLSCFEQRIILLSSECVINYTSSRPSISTCSENFILSASFASAFLIPNAVRKRQGEEKTERERQRGKKWKNAPIQCGRAALVRVCPILIYLFVLWIFFSDCRSSCACVIGYLFLIMRCFVHAMRFGGISLFPPAICCCCFHCSWTDIGHCLFSRVLCTELVDDTGEKK